MHHVLVDALTSLARTQHGLFRADQAAGLGVSANQLATLVTSGWCERPRRGIYRAAAVPITANQLSLTAAWFAGTDALISHRDAARVWWIPGFAAVEPEVTKLRGQSQRRSYGLVHGSLVLPSSHRTERNGLPVTTVARTIFDLAGVIPAGRVERAMDHALATKLCTTGQLQQVFFALARRGRRGTAVMRELLEARGEGYVAPASELERKGRALFAAGGLPPAVFEVDLGDDSWVGRVDCLWPAQKVIVELDGRRHHSALVDREADRRRDNALMAAGWRVIRVTWDDLVHRPTAVLAWIRAALDAAAPAA